MFETRQAILSPEVEMGRGELFNRTIESLLNIATDGLSECRIHAMNILRNLYRESRLNQVIGPYVARGLMLSITGFEAPDWAVNFYSISFHNNLIELLLK